MSETRNQDQHSNGCTCDACNPAYCLSSCACDGMAKHEDCYREGIKACKRCAE